MQDQICLLTDVDATSLPKPFVKWAGEAAQASEVPAVLAHAIRIAVTPPMGPVFVSIPLDDVEYEFTAAQQADVELLTARSYTAVSSFDPEVADDLAVRLARATSSATAPSPTSSPLRKLPGRPSTPHRSPGGAASPRTTPSTRG